MILGHVLHLNHLKKHLGNINVKIIYFQSMFNRQVLTSTDSMRFFARIERKKVRIIMSSDVNFPLKTFFPLVLQNSNLSKPYFDLHFYRQIIILERFFNFSGKLC